MAVLIILVVAVVGGVYILIYSLCRSAKMADDEMDEAFEKMMAERKENTDVEKA